MRMALVCAMVALLAAAVSSSASASAGHRSGCHAKHTCPSDHHTYRWNGLLCTSYANERVKADKIVRRVAGRKYWCHR